MNPADTGNSPDPVSGADFGQHGASAPYAGVPDAGAQPQWTPGYPGQPGYPGYPAPRPTNGMAIAALVTGVVSLFSCQLIGGVAVYLAKRARAEIETSGEDGAGLATAGLVLGWVALGLFGLTVLLLLAYIAVVVIIAANGS